MFPTMFKTGKICHFNQSIGVLLIGYRHLSGLLYFSSPCFAFNFMLSNEQPKGFMTVSPHSVHDGSLRGMSAASIKTQIRIKVGKDETLSIRKDESLQETSFETSGMKLD